MTGKKFPNPEYGRDLISKLPREYFNDAVVIGAPEAWQLAQSLFPVEPAAFAVPSSMEQSDIESQIASLPKAAVVFGLGGGTACDAAKLYSAMRGSRLILIPSTLSVDAAFCRAVAVRRDYRVRYVGSVEPERLLVDFALIEKAPAFLNRAGVGDVLSIYTALEDWRLARQDIDEAFDAEIALKSESLLKRLCEASEEIAACSETGLRTIAELYVEEVRLCERWGNSRPEEGSEHYFAYCLESLTRKPYIHGELVCFGILLATLAQGRPADEIRRRIAGFKVECSPQRLQLSPETLTDVLMRLPSFLEEEKQLPYGVYHKTGMTRELAESLTEKVFKLFE